jgi:hypothetical protein
MDVSRRSRIAPIGLVPEHEVVGYNGRQAASSTAAATIRMPAADDEGITQTFAPMLFLPWRIH